MERRENSYVYIAICISLLQGSWKIIMVDYYFSVPATYQEAMYNARRHCATIYRVRKNKNQHNNILVDVHSYRLFRQHTHIYIYCLFIYKIGPRALRIKKLREKVSVVHLLYYVCIPIKFTVPSINIIITPNLHGLVLIR